MNLKYFSRQSTLIDPSLLSKRVAILGVGGIGSWTAMALAKLGIRNFDLWDLDKVGEENIASQVYDYRHVDMPKVRALVNVLEKQGEDWDDLSIITHEQDILEADSLNDPDIIILAVDSLEARKAIWKKHIVYTPADLFIDGRMGGEYMRIFAVDLTNAELMDRYENSLLNAESKPADIPCSERAIVYNTQMIGGFIASLVKKHLVGQSYPNQLIFDLENYNLKALSL